ncbi:MAG: hypothetical protein IKC31_06685 [Clostridia bacterium]|nr:hypothetical protein [Clostridia bacterium]
MKKPRILAFIFKRKVSGADGEVQNPYFEEISARLGTLQVVLYLCLFAFITVSFISNSELITYQNFYHFFQDLNASVLSGEVFSEEALTYPTDRQQDFSLYRGGLVVAGNRNLTVFSSSNKQSVSENLDNYQNPAVEGTGKYVLIYELGGTRYSLYNLHQQMHTGKTDFPITGAAVSESGSFALISASEQYTSVVSLYNDRFSLINRYNKNGYVMDVDVNKKGTLISILTSEVEQGQYRTSLEIYRVGETEARTVVPLSRSVGLDCSFSTQSTVIALCADGVFFIDEQGIQRASLDFGDTPLAAYDVGEHGIAVALQASPLLPKDLLIFFDADGKLIYRIESGVRISQLEIYGDSVFALSSDSILRFSKKGEIAFAWSGMTADREMLAIDEDEILLCSPQRAIYLRMSS